MRHLSLNIRRTGAGGVLALIASAAQAHTGHGTSGLVAGLAHPFGLDHLLAMVAVGLWSVSALPASKAWWGPATFMLSLTASAAVGSMGFGLPNLEQLVSLSLVLFGLMLALFRQKMPSAFGLGMVALAASLHGLAHGSETPETGFTTYAAGFLLATAALHFGGVTAGWSIRRYFSSNATWIFTGFGSLCGGAGVYLFSQV
jgi:urease accessory protein